MQVLKIIRKRSDDSYIKSSIFALHKTCNIKHEIDIKRYGNAKNPKQIAANASVSDYLFVFFLIFP